MQILNSRVFKCVYADKHGMTIHIDDMTIDREVAKYINLQIRDVIPVAIRSYKFAKKQKS